jgi:UDP-glucose 4-epimerase
MMEVIQKRCKVVLGYTPEIIRPLPAENEQSPSLDCRIDRLLSTGFKLKGDSHLEIDDILRMCNAYSKGES